MGEEDSQSTHLARNPFSFLFFRVQYIPVVDDASGLSLKSNYCKAD